MKLAVLALIMPLLILDSILVWGALTEEEMDVIYENADFERGYRCFNWPHCVDSNSCTRISEGKDLAELIETCLDDAECVAVSCEGFSSINGGHCTRSMLSGYCDEYTKDDEDNWQIISGIKLTINENRLILMNVKIKRLLMLKKLLFERRYL